MANKRYYYAQLDADNICIGVSDLSGPVSSPDVVQLDTYDTTVQGKMWTGSEWVENPNPPEPPEPSSEPTMSDLSDKMDAQQSLQLASMQGQADQYTTTLATQEQINAQQQLILANMQGLADVYTTLLSMQTPTGTEA